MMPRYCILQFLASVSWCCIASDELTLLQMQKIGQVRTKQISNQSGQNNVSAQEPDLGEACPAEKKGWEVATLPDGVIGAGSYCISPTAAYGQVTTCLREGRLYEYATHQAIESRLKDATPGDFVTGGLFIGDYLPHLSALAQPGQRVYGVEPFPEYMRASRGTISESSLSNVFTVEAGLSNETGTTSISNGLNSVEALVVPIDKMLEPDRRVSLLHLDVEGYELLALQGAVRTLQRYHPLVVVETRDAQIATKRNSTTIQGPEQKGWVTTDEIAGYLKSFGYELSEIVDERNVFQAVRQSCVFQWHDAQ